MGSTINETKIQCDIYAAIVGSIETESANLLKDIQNSQLKDTGTVTIQEYVNAHKRINSILEKYQKHVSNVTGAMKKTELRLMLRDQEAAEAAGHVELAD